MAGKVSKDQAAKEQTATFEQRLEALEALAEKLEQGQLPLEELLKKYEEGLKLSAQLEAELEKAKAVMMEVKSGKGDVPEVHPSTVAAQGSLLDALGTEE